jgi:hypothetical protein
MPLKGHWHEIFCLWFFLSKHVLPSPDPYPKTVSNINSNSQRYSNLKSIPRCGPPPRDRILRCGPPRGIQSSDVAPPGKSFRMISALNPTVWPPPEDPILRCGPPRGIESYGVAPPEGLNPAVWPPPGDRILRCGPSREIESCGVALPPPWWLYNTWTLHWSRGIFSCFIPLKNIVGIWCASGCNTKDILPIFF